tara:strand:- start:152 stop:463 length:312 start_codon:yes stop_codon:yes gene_type:complete
MVAQGLQRGTPARRDVSPFIPTGYDNFGKLSKTWRNRGPLGLQNADIYDIIQAYKNDTLKGKKNELHDDEQNSTRSNRQISDSIRQVCPEERRADRQRYAEAV